MVCEKPVDQTKGMDNNVAMTLSNSAVQSMVASENGHASDSTSSTQHASSEIKGEIDQNSVAGNNVHNQPTNYYNYYYPGYNGPFPCADDGRDPSYMGVQGDHVPVAYYMPGYNPYGGGTVVGADGQCVSQAYYTSSGYLQPPVTYGTEAVPCYAWDLSYLGDPSHGSNAAPIASRSGPSPPSTVTSNGLKPSRLYGPATNKPSMVSSNSKSFQSATSQPKYDFQPVKPLNKSGSHINSPGFANVYRPMGNFLSSSLANRGPFANSVDVGYKSNVRMRNGNDKFRSNRKNEFEASNELTCGPRVQSKSSLNSSEQESSDLAVQKDKYNLADFQTEYETAKFYVIKSYSEDDVHKCLKYAVWSSTANGNKKLDAAFHDAEVKASETGRKCPVFLFFSVNGSGQFVGVAEMMGKVDFNRSMDFWQLDKWSGCFPIKWHIVKDIPNSQLRHILLENNENRPVTYTRDTQEIGLKQGLEMLKIFKSYSAKTTLLDDINFYEHRFKALQARRNSIKSGLQQKEVHENRYVPVKPPYILKPVGIKAKVVGEELSKPQATSVPSIISLTENLSLNSDPKAVL